MKKQLWVLLLLAAGYAQAQDNTPDPWIEEGSGNTTTNGKVGIGTNVFDKEDYKLYIDGGLHLKSQLSIGTLGISMHTLKYPMGISMDIGVTGGWRREYSFSKAGGGKLFAFGAYGNGENLSYGYIGSNPEGNLADPWMKFIPNGWVGIGVEWPRAFLDVKQDLVISSNVDAQYCRFRANDDGTVFIMPKKGWTYINGQEKNNRLFVMNYEETGNNYGELRGDGLYLAYQGAPKVSITSTGDSYFNAGKVGIGTSLLSGDYNLFVTKGIRTEKVKVDVAEGAWKDYVFEAEYPLPTLQEVEEHILQHKHLKDIPSAKEVEQNGIDVAEMDAKLLQKVEELTLYMIEMNKQLTKLQKENQSLKEQVEELKDKI
ncbi:hypothetical protein AAG747_16450 [Rapidithrix thailandica]|uniref:Uncharacterized protein n=1 Tax=Rapidithrix thailandica TaxID=413964 RepID=A0AAW9SFM4_9BACT